MIPMLSFFKKNKSVKIEKQGSDSVVSSKELINEEVSDQDIDIVTKLSIHPGMQVSTEQQYVLRFLNNELPPLKPNQVSLAGIDLREENGKVIVTAFVRNSLPKTITIKNTSLLLLNDAGQLIARKEFDLSEIGDIPPESSMPWQFTFNAGDVLIQDIPQQGWKLAFELKGNTDHRLDLEESWKEALPKEEISKLEELVKNLEKPKAGEVNFMGLQAQTTENGDLSVTLLIRNGNNKNIHFKQLPLQVEDATGNVVANGGFAFDDLQVKANTSKPWTFIFPKNLHLKEEMDLSKWKVQPIKN